MEYVLSIMEFISQYYGEVYQGSFDEKNNWIGKNYLEEIFYFLPSIFTHLYGSLSPNYLYLKNNQLFLGSYKPVNKIYPPILEMRINDKDIKDMFLKFNLETPLWTILSYYQILNKYHSLDIRYLKNGIVSNSFNLLEIREKSLGDIINH